LKGLAADVDKGKDEAMKRFVVSALVLLAAVGLFAGCGHRPGASLTPPPVVRPGAEPRESAPEPVRYRSGSLCRLDAGHERQLLVYDTPRAIAEGDIIFVLVSESFKGTGSAKTESEGSNATSYGIPEFFGYDNLFGSRANMSNLIEAKRSSNTKGDGATSRSNTLTARVAARVMEVLPGGNLRIAGQHYTLVNGEQYYVTITGIVRPTDVSLENTVSSAMIADANIEYGGTGTLASKQRLGWATYILDFLWPF
jgi:flagellar L-ring protein precursor FlgH